MGPTSLPVCSISYMAAIDLRDMLGRAVLMFSGNVAPSPTSFVGRHKPSSERGASSALDQLRRTLRWRGARERISSARQHLGLNTASKMGVALDRWSVDPHEMYVGLPWH